MKLSNIYQPVAIRILWLPLLFSAGCVAQNNGPLPAADASAIKVQKPPTDEKTDQTAPECGSITSKGKCDKGVAITCNVTRRELVRRDCDALGKDCVIDMVRGAMCLTVEQKENLDSETTCPGDKMDAEGVCIDGVAIFCDMKRAPGTINVWKCKSDTQTCEMAKCREGAFCCDINPDETKPESTEECGDYTYEGKCEENVAKWCNSDSELEVENCVEYDEICMVDLCATGAFCCNPDADEECLDMGFDCICSADKTTMTWCEGETADDIIIEDCAEDGKTCQVDGPCGSGAFCCDKPVVENKCTEVGEKGKCDGDTLIFCLGTEEKDLQEVDCTVDNMKCEVNTCKSGEASCCKPDDACPTLGTVGECDGDILRYCTLYDELKEINCAEKLDTSGDPKKCEHDTCQPGYYSCCPL